MVRPLYVVCDDAFLRLIPPSIVSQSIAISDWLVSDVIAEQSADVVIANACQSTDEIELVRRHNKTILLIAIVENLEKSDIGSAFAAGADDLITAADIVNGRLAIMLQQRFNASANPFQNPNRSNATAINSTSDSLLALAQRKDEKQAANDSVAGSTDLPLQSEINQLELRNKFMSALSEVSTRLLERKSLDELMDHIAQQAVILANADCAFVSMLHE